MSQSGYDYGGQDPKDTARARREREENESDAESADESGEPACRSRAVGHSVEKREWREIRFVERRVACYRPCTWPECFPDGPPDPNEIETVVRSSHRPTVYHRPQEAKSGDCDEDGDSTAPGEHEPVTTITNLREGETVVWEGQRWSMSVAETATKPDGVVHLAGSNGGHYRIEGRPDNARPFAIYPGVGIVAELYRVGADHDRPERV